MGVPGQRPSLRFRVVKGILKIPCYHDLSMGKWGLENGMVVLWGEGKGIHDFNIYSTPRKTCYVLSIHFFAQRPFLSLVLCCAN